MLHMLFCLCFLTAVHIFNAFDVRSLSGVRSICVIVFVSAFGVFTFCCGVFAVDCGGEKYQITPKLVGFVSTLADTGRHERVKAIAYGDVVKETVPAYDVIVFEYLHHYENGKWCDMLAAVMADGTFVLHGSKIMDFLPSTVDLTATTDEEDDMPVSAIDEKALVVYTPPQ